MHRVVLCSVAALAIAAAAVATTSAQTDTAATPGHRGLTVMTRNVYHGVDTEIFAAAASTSYEQLVQRARAVYEGYYARKFPARAAALAADIAAARPEIVALQEVMLVRTQSPPDGAATPATNIDLDYLQLLLDALAARGVSYTVVGQSTNIDIEMPSACEASPLAPCFDVRHTDRDVILARADLRPDQLQVSDVRSGLYTAACHIPSALVPGGIPLPRGWLSMDGKVRDARFRFVTTHLDGDCLPFTVEIQRAQAAELLAGPAATSLPLVVAGDLNSPADGSGITYNDLAAAGFGDAWIDAGNTGGATCCQAPTVLNPLSQLSRRIDLVLTRGGVAAEAAAIVGADPSSRTPAGYWGSDHAGVVARLRVSPSSDR